LCGAERCAGRVEWEKATFSPEAIETWSHSLKNEPTGSINMPICRHVVHRQKPGTGNSFVYLSSTSGISSPEIDTERLIMIADWNASFILHNSPEGSLLIFLHMFDYFTFPASPGKERLNHLYEISGEGVKG
jgi:hypothetical protein